MNTLRAYQIAVGRIVAQRNNPPVFSRHRVALVDDVPTITDWDVGVLGPLPTPEEIESVLVPVSLPVPQQVTSWRLRAVASLAGHKATIEAVLDGLPDPDKTVAKEAWASGLIRRNAPLITVIGNALEMTSADIDNWFRQAADIHD